MPEIVTIFFTYYSNLTADIWGHGNITTMKPSGANNMSSETFTQVVKNFNHVIYNS